MKTRKLSEARKADILLATLELAFEVGPDHVTTGLIAGKLGLTQPAIYKHFPKKDDIWQAVTQLLCDRISENTRFGLSGAHTPEERIRSLIGGHLLLVSKFPALPEIMATRDPAGTRRESRRRVQAAMAEFRVALAQCLEEMRSVGRLRATVNIEDGVTLLIGIIQSLVLRLLVSHDPERLVQEGARLLDLQLELFDSEGVLP